VVPEHVAVTLAQLDECLSALLELRYAALSPGEVRAVVRAVTVRQSRWGAVGLRGLGAIDARDDVVPMARPGQASVAFAEHALGLAHATARRDSTAAHVLDPDTGDLRAMGAAFAAGSVLRGHVDVAVRTHRDLGERLREETVPLDVDPETGQIPETAGTGAGSRRWTPCSPARPSGWAWTSSTGSPATWSTS
jgi:hypothetical protein